MPRIIGVLLLAVLMAGCCSDVCSGNPGAQKYFDSARQNPAALLSFLQKMPKGGDLHNHLGGAVYAENLIGFAAQDNLCFDRASEKLKPMKECGKGNSPNPRDCFGAPSAQKWVPACDSLFHDMLDAFSMRDFKPHCDPTNNAATGTLCESGHDHFFATFDKFGLATQGHTPEMIAEVANRAAAQNESYLELMFGLDDGAAGGLSQLIHWDGVDADAVSAIAQQVHGNPMFAKGVDNLHKTDAEWHSRLHCSDPQRKEPGCAVEVRYLYQALRGLPPNAVLSRLITGFEMVQEDERRAKAGQGPQLIVGLNLVMPEDGYFSMHDFDLHMRILQKLHAVYPEVKLSLHAGELAPGLVTPDGLRDHISKSVYLAGAERIGHGVDVGYEDNHEQLLKDMAARHVLVEICLTSNDGILGISGAGHPLKTYLDSKVPVALATDDEGVSRSDMTQEYLRAAETYSFLEYDDLKRMARMSLEHSFLPGASLWKDAEQFHPTDACARQQAGADTPSPGCKRFLDGSERARVEWKLEGQFLRFEKNY